MGLRDLEQLRNSGPYLASTCILVRSLNCRVRHKTREDFLLLQLYENERPFLNNLIELDITKKTSTTVYVSKYISTFLVITVIIVSLFNVIIILGCQISPTNRNPIQQKPMYKNGKI